MTQTQIDEAAVEMLRCGADMMNTHGDLAVAVADARWALYADSDDLGREAFERALWAIGKTGLETYSQQNFLEAALLLEEGSL